MLEQMSIPPSVELEVVCVIDGSNDGSIKMLNLQFPWVHQVIGDGNWWYTRSMNEGFKYSTSLEPDFILTLNDDIILSKDYLEKLWSAYNSKNSPCIMGSVSFTHKPPHRITYSGIKNWNRFLDKSTPYFPFLSKVEPSDITGIYSTPVLPGRGTLIPWELLNELNFFDEKFAQYHSDFDFTLRALKMGIPIFVCWNAQVFSYIEKSSSTSSFLKSSFASLLMSFGDPHSRSYLPDKARYFWRHCFKLLWPCHMIKFFITSFRNYFLKYKIA